MLGYLRIGKILEEDFDLIVAEAGGSRYSADHSREIKLNADYRLGNAVIELKFSEEEGLEKDTHRGKMAALFRGAFPDRPTLILEPSLLEENDQRKYYRILETPVKRRIRKADKQLAKSAKDEEARVLILVNNGYGALSHEEFKSLAIKCATNDTSNVDVLITCGLYFYSDLIDNYVISHFEPTVIRKDRVVISQDSLHDAYNRFVGRFMTAFVKEPEARIRDRLPVLDLEFQMDGFRYVKPAPQMGKPSNFWVHGRPRKNSTGIETCPPVATVFPNVSKAEWEIFVRETSFPFWKSSFQEWVRFREEEMESANDPMRPLVPFSVTYSGFSDWVEKTGEHSFASLSRFAMALFQEAIDKQIDRASKQSEFKLELPKFIGLFVEEIGQDKANDISSIYLVEDRGEQEDVTPLLENQPIFFEYALCLACAYAIKHGASIVLHEVDKTFGWV
jgi:hypothetical protein